MVREIGRVVRGYRGNAQKETGGDSARFLVGRDGEGDHRESLTGD